jgi:hypothetical protein
VRPIAHKTNTAGERNKIHASNRWPRTTESTPGSNSSAKHLCLKVVEDRTDSAETVPFQARDNLTVDNIVPKPK